MRVFEEKEKCSGCTACKYICPVQAIEMVPDEEGFLYPEIDESKCIECNLCRNLCPFNNVAVSSESLTIPQVFAAKNNNEEVRLLSSSGGVFSVLSDYILQEGGVVYGARFDEKLRVFHARAESSKERDPMRGSKYVQSELRDSLPTIKQDLSNDRKVLFTGTPCQISGLKTYFHKEEIDNLVLCDLICYGTPSPLVWKEFVDLLEKKVGLKLKDFNFRDKCQGWHKIWAKAHFEEEFNNLDESLVNSFNKIFLGHFVLRPACHECPFSSLRRHSDITIADFWGIEKHKPEFDDDKGVSLVLVNTPKGEEVFERIKYALSYQDSSVDECIERQVHLQRPATPSPQREVFWRDFREQGIESVIRKYTYPSLLKRINRKLLKPVLLRLGLYDSAIRVFKKKK